MHVPNIQSLKERSVPSGLLLTTSEWYESETRAMPDVATLFIPRMFAHRELAKHLSLTPFCTLGKEENIFLGS